MHCIKIEKRFYNTLNKYFPNQTKVTITSIDTNEFGSIVSEYITKKITESSGSLEETFILTKGCKIILIKNINIEFKISNILDIFHYVQYIGHSEYIGHISGFVFLRRVTFTS